MRLCLTLLLAGCVSLSTVPPVSEVTVVAVSSGRDVALAESVARNRAIARAGQIKQGLGFVLDRSRAKPMLKVFTESTAGVIPSVEPRKPSGMRATIALQRTPAELQALAALKVARMQTEASGLDIAVAHDRADRTLYKEAILLFAKAEGKKERVLSGRITIVNYTAEDEKNMVRVQADVHVSFGAVEQKAKTADVANEELEEVEPPEEQR